VLNTHFAFVPIRLGGKRSVPLKFNNSSSLAFTSGMKKNIIFINFVDLFDNDKSREVGDSISFIFS
jgi:hypothetical protein